MTQMQVVTLVTAIAGAITGVLGAVLGMINTWHQLNTSRVKLKVVPKMAFGQNAGWVGDRPNELYTRLVQSRTPARLCVEVVNLSAFPVTIRDVGFGRTSAIRHTLINADLSAEKTWPPRLESREAVTVYAPVGEDLNLNIMQKPVAYVKTDCGITRYGSSPILKEYVRRLRSAHTRESVDNKEQSTT